MASALETVNLAQAATPAIAAFLASLVEFVEAMTIVLAVGAVRGWRSALGGAGLGLLVLLVMVALLGPALLHIPQDLVQLAVGSLLLLFGMRWLRKAILRAAGVIALHDETAAYAKATAQLGGGALGGGALGGGQLGGGTSGLGRWDRVAVATAFKITMLEGIEVVFIVVAVGAGGTAPLAAAAAGAAASLLAVILLGFALHRPIASIPENALKFMVGVLLCAFGAFWAGEGMGLAWPGADWALLALIAGFFAAALATVPLCRRRASLG